MERPRVRIRDKTNQDLCPDGTHFSTLESIFESLELLMTYAHRYEATQTTDAHQGGYEAGDADDGGNELAGHQQRQPGDLGLDVAGLSSRNV